MRNGRPLRIPNHPPFSPPGRHFLLSNGSLLIVNSQTTDSGKYRCNATNQFAKKLSRSSFSILTVAARSAKDDNHESRLLPQLQNSTQKIKSGQNLVLHCASSGVNKVRNVPKNHVTGGTPRHRLFSTPCVRLGRRRKPEIKFFIPFCFFFPTDHRFHGHSRHVPATSQSACTSLATS